MTDTLDRHQRIRALFDSVLEQDPAHRAAYLADQTAGDATLRQAVERLLAAHGSAQSFLETPLASVLSDGESESERARDASAGAGAADADAARSPWIGRRLGPYEIVREIGHGGMGAVYLAVRADDQYRAEVAIKVVSAGLVSRHIADRFSRERRILASLEHPHIARLLDAGTAPEGVPYVVMEYVDGQPMDAYCDRRQLTIAARLRLFSTVCAAVQYAHRHLVVHRDLKPTNILVTADGTVKLVDFGIAKLLADDDLPEAGLTRTGLQPMTPEYASPEQVRGERVTTSSDVYALGLLLYELLTGRRAHALPSLKLDDVKRVILDDEPPRPSIASATDAAAAARGASTVEKLRRELSGDLDQIVLTALRKEPERRYSSVSALSEDVASFLAQRPVAARGESVWYRAGKFVRRHRAGVAAALLLIIALLGGGVATAWQAKIAERERSIALVERARAERRFNDVRKLANSFLFEFHDAVAPLAGSTPARKLVVEKALQYLDSLIVEAGDDLNLQNELATAYEKVGDVQGNPAQSNLGDTDGARISYRKAYDIRKAVAARVPGDRANTLALSGTSLRLADMALMAGSPAEAAVSYREANATAEAMLAIDASNATARRTLSSTSGRLCAVLKMLGDAPGMLQSCRVALRLAQQAPAGIRKRYEIGALTSMGDAYAENDRWTDAIDHYTRAMTAWDVAIKDAPTNAQFQARLARVHWNIAVLKDQLHDANEATSHFSSAIKLFDALYRADAADVSNGEMLGELLCAYGDFAARHDAAAEARQVTTRGLGILAEIAGKPQVQSYALNAYANCLATTPVDELRNPALAVTIATRAAAQTHTPDPSSLRILALAHGANHDPASALREAERAQAALAPVPPGTRSTGIRRKIETEIATYRSATTPTR